MSTITTKLWRELWRQRGQMFSIAAVVAVGIMTVLTMRGAYESLAASQDSYYRETRFPAIWALLERAPEALKRRIELLPSVSAVDTRVTFTATLDIEGQEGPATGLFVSIPPHQRKMIADLTVRGGRYVSQARGEVLVSEKFAEANGFVIGDQMEAVLNGRLRSLRIVGTAISPEHIYSIPPGALYPDDARYGIIWMSRDELGPAFDMEGAFNEVVLTTAPDADVNQLLNELDRLLEPYGGRGAYARADQLSHALLQSELDSVESMGTAIPVVFLGVAAFLLNLVLGRMISTQRTEVAVLKAFGYSNLQVGAHYVGFAMVAVLAGVIVGSVAGILLGQSMVKLYGAYFSFPTLRYEVSPTLMAIAAGAGVVAAGMGALGVVRKAVSLPPAEAMRPEPPASFEPGPIERLGLGRVLPAAGRMILRNIERQPVRTLFSIVGVSFSVAILVIGMSMFDGVGYMMRLQFGVAQREDLSLTFNRPVSSAVRHDLAHLDGVARVEPFRIAPVRLRVGHRKHEAAITGLEFDSQLRQIVTTSGGVQPIPSLGIMLSDLLADKLGVDVGDTISVEFLNGDKRRTDVPVSGIVGDFIGVAVYANLDDLDRIAGGGRVISGAYLSVDDDRLSEINGTLKQLPAVASVASPPQMLKAFEDQLADSLYVSVLFILGFSGVIAVAVIYNGARISLSERGRELASLRVLGFSRNEVAVLLFGEQAVSTIIALPIGCYFGFLLAAAVAAGIASESYRIPLVVNPQSYLIASLITVTAALVSAWIVRRRLDRMDLIAVLKTRE